ncbi:hypothetical protein scyTo_0002334 [Scyliorhinus torazame]|uniref:Small ribosomal subunit protein uS2 C-terminal domain-containing protein n=1 Tax=Scyliorhinus torazame TaxID=75743 RepID=A0A401PIX1_SCYTO|nr:hypothetical protein [Scyliorhinus torazame]
MRGTIRCEHPWEVMPDLYFYRDPDEIEEEEQAAAEKAAAEKLEAASPYAKPATITPEPATKDWSAQPAAEDWSAAPTAQAPEWGSTTADWS